LRSLAGPLDYWFILSGPQYDALHLRGRQDLPSRGVQAGLFGLATDPHRLTPVPSSRGG